MKIQRIREQRIISQEGSVNKMRTRYRHDLDSVREMSNELMELVILCYDKIDLYLENHNKKKFRRDN